MAGRLHKQDLLGQLAAGCPLTGLPATTCPARGLLRPREAPGRLHGGHQAWPRFHSQVVADRGEVAERVLGRALVPALALLPDGLEQELSGGGVVRRVGHHAVDTVIGPPQSGAIVLPEWAGRRVGLDGTLKPDALAFHNGDAEPGRPTDGELWLELHIKQDSDGLLVIMAGELWQQI